MLQYKPPRRGDSPQQLAGSWCRTGSPSGAACRESERPGAGVPQLLWARGSPERCVCVYPGIEGGTFLLGPRYPGVSVLKEPKLPVREDRGPAVGVWLSSLLSGASFPLKDTSSSPPTSQSVRACGAPWAPWEAFLGASSGRVGGLLSIWGGGCPALTPFPTWGSSGCDIGGYRAHSSVRWWQALSFGSRAAGPWGRGGQGEDRLGTVGRGQWLWQPRAVAGDLVIV